MTHRTRIAALAAAMTLLAAGAGGDHGQLALRRLRSRRHRGPGRRRADGLER